MATNTPNYNLSKPAPSDLYDIAVHNSNSDKIDTAIKAVADATQNITNAQLAGDITADKLAGNIPTSKLTGTITNSQLAGGITNDKLAGSISAAKLAGGIGNTLLAGGIANDKLAGGITQDKLVSVPASKLTGTITNAQLAGGITQDKLDGSIPFSKTTGVLPIAQLPFKVFGAAVPTASIPAGVTSAFTMSVPAGWTQVTSVVATPTTKDTSIEYITESPRNIYIKNTGSSAAAKGFFYIMYGY